MTTGPGAKRYTPPNGPERKVTSVAENASRRGGGGFATTHWSVVVAAGGPDTALARAALETLCGLYWYPLYAYVRRNGYAADRAEDLVQAFFARLLEKHSLRQASAERGRFRSFLLVSFKHFLVNEYDRARAARRGGGERIASLDITRAEGRYALEPRDEVTPETLFERRWAQTLIERVQVRLRSTFVRGGKGALFEHLKGFTTGEDSDVPCREIGIALGMSEGAVRVAVHRLRRRFREVLREEIQHTVGDPGQIDDEVSFLLKTVAAIGSPNAE
jgi:RNA polymerase sigma factor (sigma-70 family)